MLDSRKWVNLMDADSMIAQLKSSELYDDWKT
jgi:hypothetical protein